MFSPFERLIAFRYLRSRRAEGFISVIAGFSLLGIALGVATLIVVMSVMNGFRAELVKRILGINGHVVVYGYGGYIDNYDKLAKDLATIHNVNLVRPMIEGQVMAVAHGNTNGALIKSFRLEDLKNKKLLWDNLQLKNEADFSGTEAVILGAELARNLGVFPGDTLTLISPQGNNTIMGSIPRHKDYRVVGTFNVGMYEYDSSTILMPLEAGQLFFKLPNRVNAMEVITDNPQQAGAVADEIILKTRGQFSITDWQQSNASFFNALKVERTVMFLILTLIIVVAAFNIISSMIMLVNDKGRNIAILRTMGATKGMIMRIFFMTGASIGVVGTFMGFALGVGFASNIEAIRKWLESLTGNKLFDPVIYYLAELPAEIENGEVASVVVMGLVLSFLATLYPAWKAARMNPAEALRYE